MEGKKVERLRMTVKEAESIYKKNNCSLYAMSRDEKKYFEYKELNIDIALERKWKTEVIKDLVDLLVKTGDSKIFNRLYDLSVSIHDRERLELMIMSIELVKLEDVRTSLCIAETIMGRKNFSCRDGMIFWAYDIGEKEKAIDLIKKVLFLIRNNSEEKERAIDDMKRIQGTIEILNIKL